MRATLLLVAVLIAVQTTADAQVRERGRRATRSTTTSAPAVVDVQSHVGGYRLSPLPVMSCPHIPVDELKSIAVNGMYIPWATADEIEIRFTGVHGQVTGFQAAAAGAWDSSRQSIEEMSGMIYTQRIRIATFDDSYVEFYNGSVRVSGRFQKDSGSNLRMEGQLSIGLAYRGRFLGTSFSGTCSRIDSAFTADKSS